MQASEPLLGPHGEGSTFAATTRGLASRTVREKRILRKEVKRWMQIFDVDVEVLAGRRAGAVAALTMPGVAGVVNAVAAAAVVNRRQRRRCRDGRD